MAKTIDNPTRFAAWLNEQFDAVEAGADHAPICRDGTLPMRSSRMAGMANHIRIPLYKLLIVAVIFTAAIFGGFFSLRHGYGQNDAADAVFAATAATIMALYFLCRRGAVMSVGLIASLVALSGFRWSGSAHFKGEEPSISSGLFGAFIGATIGVLVGCVVIASRSWGESRKTRRLD